MQKSTHLIVVKSNKVVEASYMLSLAEQRVLLACIAQIDSKAILTDQYRFEVSAGEIVELAGLESVSNAYRDLKKAAEKLYERSVIIDDPDPDNPQITQRKTRWISSIDYLPGEGKLVLSFSFGIIPYLSQLSKEFTKYKLKHVARFESVYSIRLYELLVQWSASGQREIEVEWLKKQFQVEEKYGRLGDLKKRVIEPAVAEINEHSNLWVTYDQKKVGRVVTHFLFHFGLKGKPQERRSLIEDEVEGGKRTKISETKVPLVGRLENNALVDFAPGSREIGDQVFERKKNLAEMKKILG
ncbi:MAG: replication initiation protein [Gammaproteobacteria bacterium]